MKIRKWFVAGILCGSVLMTGCGKEISTEEFDLSNTENVTENSAGADEDAPVQQNIGTVLHGADWSEDEENYSFVYDGGELEIPYSMNASGICKSTGFLIFLDGMPQPYRIKGTEEEYKYMHIIEGEESTDTEFVISFIPVTGKKGEKVSLSINSIANPSFLPDMVSTFDYGMSHQSLEAVYDIAFNQDAETVPQASDTQCLLSNVENQQTDIDEKEKSYIEEKSLEPELDLDKRVYHDLLIDDNSMMLDGKMDISDKNQLHISYIMMGHPGVKYKVNFYLDHQLLTDETGDVYEMELATGKMNKIAFDMDVSEVENGTFYAVIVPVNANDYPNDSIGTMKYQSIHLYRGGK